MAAVSKAMDALLARSAALEPGDRLDVGGLPGAAGAFAIARLLAERAEPALVVAPDELTADRLATDLAFFLGAGTADAPRVLRLPADGVLPYDALSPDRPTIQARLAALFHLHHETGVRALVVDARALARRLLPVDVLGEHSQAVAVGEQVDRDELARRLTGAGYQNVPLVEDPGTFALRGGILDVYSPVYEAPLRIDFFGDEVEAIRRFDPESQRTLEEVRDVYLPPVRETLFDERTIRNATLAVRDLADAIDRPTRRLRSLIDEIERGSAGFGIEALLPGFYDEPLAPLGEYLGSFGLSVVVDPMAVEAQLTELWGKLIAEHEDAESRGELAFDPSRHFVSLDEAWAQVDAYPRVDLHEMLVEDRHREPVRFNVQPTASLRQEIEQHHGEEGALTPLVARLKRWREDGNAAVIACVTAGQADRLKRLLLDRELMVRTVQGPFDAARPHALYEPSVHAHLMIGELSTGFVDGEQGLALLADTDILGRSKSRRTAQPGREVRPEEAFAAHFRELEEGDYVVHIEHGIGRYGGLTRLSVRGIDGDFLLLEYAGKDRIYLPVHRLRQVQKYVGKEGENIRLDKLGGQTFTLRKKRVKEELLKMAAELLDIYAARKAHPGTAFSAPDTFYRQFEAEFAYQETRDQDRAIEAVIDDMQKTEPMDRLVCGDVGFGKTEVAMRAAMKAVLDGKQVAVLVPTTVLATQHAQTFGERFSGYPVTIEVLSRFRSPKETREVIARCKEGQVDILIGTHRLLSKDLGFKDLGLLVVDEEQRFGVKQKEALKKLRRQVDVLTLTATPIPRTLHMSMSGIRDLSLIATPPMDRRAIRTFVSRFDGATIREAVERELGRGGQVFYVHNRVQSIRGVERYLRELLPGVRIEVAHGQMNERTLEKAMTRFVGREADVLLCTAIIESGLDIPSVNTIIINRADAFGLAQLYQLRGRVGRSRERAYCYLLVPARRPITKDAKKRLSVLQQLTDLGAGFRLASHDLEIRGAGNLLGPSQSGHIAAVGFDLYAQMLDEAVRELRGEEPRDDVDPEVTLPVPSFLPDDYVVDVHQRLGLYKRLNQVGDREDLMDLRAEMVDRYGELPEEAENLVRVMAIKQGLSRLRLRALEAGPGRLVFTLGDAARLDPARLAAHIEKAERGHRGRLRLTPELKLVAKVRPETAGAAYLDAADALLGELDRAAGPTGG